MMRIFRMRAIQWIYSIEKRDGLHLILSMPIAENTMLFVLRSLSIEMH